jgi:hypothetical protein
VKVRIVGNWEFELTPESSHEVKVLKQQFAIGHVHLVCKALMRPDRRASNKRKRLLLTPSMIRWQRPT